MSKAVELRAQLKGLMSERGVSFSYMPFVIKAVSLALREYPTLNAHVNQDCTSIRYKADHNIGVAVDTPQGLIVPNIKQVQVMKGCGYGCGFELEKHYLSIIFFRTSPYLR